MNSDGTIRFVATVSVLLLMSIWETLTPRRVRVASRPKRSIHNLLLVAIDVAVLRLLPVLSVVGAARWCASRGIGVLNHIELPGWCETVIAVVLLDFVIYWQHVAAHRVPLFWSFHRVHHADLDLDATSGLRFHPVEIVLSAIVKMAAVAVIGASGEAVLVFEIVLNACAIFNHSNVRLSVVCDQLLRLFVVTPDMHRVHHSIDMAESRRNFGFNLPWWDWLFGTYLSEPQADHATIPLGLPDRRDEGRTIPVLRLLRMPWERE